MSRELRPLQIMRKGVMALSIACAVSVLLLGGSWWTRDQRNNELTTAERGLRDARDRQSKAERAQQVIENDLPTYMALEQRGVVGTEQRLAWLQALVESGAKLKLPGMQYRIDSQEPFTPDYINFGGNYEVRRSDMTFTLQAFHEGDVLDILATLEQQAPGLFQVADCEASRLQAASEIASGTPNVSAECRLRWFTLGQPHVNGAPG